MENNQDKFYIIVKSNDDLETKVDFKFDKDWFSRLTKYTIKEIVFYLESALQLTKHIEQDKCKKVFNKSRVISWQAVLDMRNEFASFYPNKEFQFGYKDIMEKLNWKYERSKKWILTLLNSGFIDFIDDSYGGRGKRARYKIVESRINEKEQL